MRILGIDPGYGTVGFGVIEFIDSDWEAVDFGAITTEPNTIMPERLLQIHEDVITLIDEFEPNVMAVEELYFAQNVTTGLQVSEARGVILLAAGMQNMQVFEYAPNEIKMHITGYGQAEKIQVQNMIQSLLNLKERPKPDDAADALAVALTCGFDRVRL
jgi:crossover junction endodeoxyribonuclease RuvC